jgi:hypothetical protein
MARARSLVDADRRYVGAAATSTLLKLLCGVWVVGGLVVIFETGRSYVTGSGLAIGVVIAIEIVSTLLGTAILAFTAYALELLMGLWEEVASET